MGSHYLCGYCGGRLARRSPDHPLVHATSGDRVRTIRPGDMVSDQHNRKGTTVGAADIVEVRGVKAYLILLARVCTDDYVTGMSMPAYRWPGGQWTIRSLTTVTP